MTEGSAKRVDIETHHPDATEPAEELANPDAQTLDALTTTLNEIHRSGTFSGIDLDSLFEKWELTEEYLDRKADGYVQQFELYAAHRHQDLAVRIADSLLAVIAASGLETDEQYQARIHELRESRLAAKVWSIILDAQDDAVKGSPMKANQRLWEADELLAKESSFDKVRDNFQLAIDQLKEMTTGLSCLGKRDFAGARVGFSKALALARDHAELLKARLGDDQNDIDPQGLIFEVEGALRFAEAEEQLGIGNLEIAADKFDRAAGAKREAASAITRLSAFHHLFSADAWAMESRAYQARAESARSDGNWSLANTLYNSASECLDQACDAALKSRSTVGKILQDLVIRTAYAPIYEGRRSIQRDRLLYERIDALESEVAALRSVIATALSAKGDIVQDFSNLVSISDSLKQTTQTAVAVETNVQTVLRHLVDAIPTDLLVDPMVRELKREGEQLALEPTPGRKGFASKVGDYARRLSSALERAGGSAGAVQSIAETLRMLLA